MNNCFMYRRDKGNCSALKIRYMACGTKGCPFYKTEDEQIEQMEKARERCFKLKIPYGEEYSSYKAKKVKAMKSTTVVQEVHE